MPLAALRWFTHQVRFSHDDNRECSKTLHATGFSQWLMTKFLSAEFIRHLVFVNWRVVLPHDRNFRQCSSTALQKTIRQSLLANRCRFGSAGASPSHFPRPSPLAPLKVGAQVSCHQLRTKVRSMDDSFCAGDNEIKPVARSHKQDFQNTLMTIGE